MTKQPWFRVLIITLIAFIVFAGVGAAAYRLGFQAGQARQFTENFAGRQPQPFGGRDGGAQRGFQGGFQGGFEGGQRFGSRSTAPLSRMFLHMRPGFGGFWFHPALVIGLLVLVLLVILFARAVTPQPAPTKARRQRS